MKFILIALLVLGCSSAQELTKDMLSIDEFGEQSLIFTLGDSELSNDTVSKLDCFISFMEKHELDCKEMIFIVHNYEMKTSSIELYLDALKNIKLYLVQNSSNFVNTPHRFYYGTKWKSKNPQWSMEVQFIYLYLDEKGALREGTFDFTRCE